MITLDLGECRSLREFYARAREQHERAHGRGYCAQHDAIEKYLCGGSYKEIGVFQGVTAAAACLTNPKSVELQDIDLRPFLKYRHLFEEHCSQNGIALRTRQCSSLHAKTASWCDVLLIDSLHTARHLLGELKIHAPLVSRNIIVHDTSMIGGKPNEGLYFALCDFVWDHIEWNVVERNGKNVGYTVLGRVSSHVQPV